MRPGPSSLILVLALACGGCLGADSSKRTTGASPSAIASRAASPSLSASESKGAWSLPRANHAPGCPSGNSFGPAPSTEGDVKQWVARAIDAPMVGHKMLLKAWPQRPGASVALVFEALERFRKPEEIDAHVVLLERSVADLLRAEHARGPSDPGDPARQVDSVTVEIARSRHCGAPRHTGAQRR